MKKVQAALVKHLLKQTPLSADLAIYDNASHDVERIKKRKVITPNSIYYFRKRPANNYI